MQTSLKLYYSTQTRATRARWAATPSSSVSSGSHPGARPCVGMVSLDELAAISRDIDWLRGSFASS